MKLQLKNVVAYFKDREVSLWSKLLGLFAVAYVVSPIDLVPDVIPVFGWLDDVGVVGLVVAYYLRQINQHARRRLLPPAAAP